MEQCAPYLSRVRHCLHGDDETDGSAVPCSDAEAKKWKEARRAGREAQMAIIAKEFADAGWQSDRLIEGMLAASDYYFSDLAQIQLTPWAKGRIVCLGEFLHMQ